MIDFHLKNIVAKDMSFLFKYVPEKKFQKYLSKNGEHYKFLASLSDLFENETIVDVGTFKGLSALSLAMNKKNKVVTVNIEERSNFLGKATDLPITQVIQDITKITDYPDGNPDLIEDIKKAAIVVLDITHNGKDEQKFYEFLHSVNFKGILVADDMRLTRLGDMPGFWNSIKETKYDLTEYGHWSGTGVVDFDNQLNIIGR